MARISNAVNSGIALEDVVMILLADVPKPKGLFFPRDTNKYQTMTVDGQTVSVCIECRGGN